MAAVFGATTADRVAFGSASDIDNLTALTALLWIYPTTITGGRNFITKHPAGGTGWFFDFSSVDATGDIRCFMARATTNQLARSNNTPVTTNAWHFVVCSIGTSVSPKMYVGTLTSPPTEVTYDSGSYSAGSGAKSDDNAGNLIVANVQADLTQAFQGRIAGVKLIAANLTLAQIRQQWGRWSPIASTRLYCEMGWQGAASFQDWSGNNRDHSAVVGTITLAAHPPRVAPLVTWFDDGIVDSIPAGAIVLTADPGSYNLSGQNVTLKHGRRVAVDSGAYDISGQDVTLKRGYRVPADSGTYNLTGQDVSTVWDRILDAASGSYDWAGTDVTLKRGYRIDVEPGSYIWTGQDVTLIVSGGNIVLIAEPGSYLLTGTDVDLKKGYRVDAESGVYDLTGQDVLLKWMRRLDVESGPYVWTGQAVSLEFGRVLQALSGSYNWNGEDVELIYAPVSGANKRGLLELYNIKVVLQTKREIDSGLVVADKDDVNGTLVNFNKSFRDVESITLTTDSFEPVYAIYDFVDIPNPTEFYVFAYDSSGHRITYPVSWKARGKV